MKPNFNWDGQNVGARRMRDPFTIGALLLNIVPSLSFGIAGALGIGITTLATGVGYLVLAGAAYGLSVLGRKQPASAKPSDVQSNIRQEISARRRIYDRYLTGSVIIFGFRRGEKSYLLHYICEGPIEGFVSFRLDKKPVTLDEDGFVQEEQYIVKGRSRVQILTTLGTMSDEAFAELIAAFPELDTPMTPFRHRGCAMVLQIVEQVPQKYLQDTYPNNMPSLQVVIDGTNTILDPRTESVGLTGNAGLCLLHEIMDVYGLTPADTDEIDFDAFAVFADYCDVDIALKAGGTEKRWRCAGPIDLSAENEARVQAIASICNADVFIDRMGRFSVTPKLRQTPGIALRAKNGDFLTIGIDGGRPLLKRSNTAKITYVDPALNYKANELRWRDTALFAEDGTEYVLPVTATLCPSPTQAQRIGKLALADANPEFIGSLTSGPQALDLMEDYVFTLDLSPEDNFERVACATDVIEYNQQEMTVSTSFMIFREGAESWNAVVDEQDEVVVPIELPANVDDVALDVTVVVELQNNSAPVLKFSWVAAGAAVLPDSYAQAIEVSPADAEDWAAANVNQDDNTAVFGPVADGGTYDWRIRNRSSGKTFDWQVSSVPVTVVVDTVAPLALTSFALAASAPHLGHAPLAMTTANDSHLRGVKIFRKVSGTPLDLETDTPVFQLAVGALSTYTYIDGDGTRPNLVSNGSFSTDTVWSKGAGWAISAGKASKTAGTSSYLLQTVGAVAAGTYRYGGFTSGISAGSLTPRVLGSTTTSGPGISANGQFFGTLLNADPANTQFGVAGSASFVGSIDDLAAYLETDSCAPSGVWDYYAVPVNVSGVIGPTSGPLAIAII